MTEVFEKSSPQNLAGSVSYASGSIVSKIITRNEAGNLTLFAFDKGQNLSEHTAPFDAIIQVIDGEARVTIDKKAYQVKTGEFIIMPANIPHAVDADEKFKMLLTMIKEKKEFKVNL
ncbi:MAG: cupin domain-containing protein [Bacteroidota bacterium]|nr:MAG: cupin domain-containing protein [Bacteroidota bacterium]